MNKVNKSDLIELLAARSSVTYTEAEKILNNLSSIIYQTLSENGVVNWHGFGRFSVYQMKPMIRRNPHTKELMTVPAHNRPKFLSGEQLKQAVHGTKY